MKRISIPGLELVRSLSLAGTAMLVLSIAASQRTEAMSPINPGLSSTAQHASDALTIPVHGGHGGHGGGHWGGGGGHWHGGFARFHQRRFLYGGYYPYYDSDYYYYPACRVVWTYWGPRRICYHGHYWHRWHRYHYWHRHHRWHYRHWW